MAGIVVPATAYLPGYEDAVRRGRSPDNTRWIWDDGFCGSIGFRWRSGTSTLPAHVLGHIGYSAVSCRGDAGAAMPPGPWR